MNYNNEVNNLRRVVFSKYKTIQDFAAALNWPNSKASRIINGMQYPNSDEIIEIIQCLELSTIEMVEDTFFR